MAELRGQMSSQVQFYTTGMAHHFLRGALYFNTASQNDYLEPIVTLIRLDKTSYTHAPYNSIEIMMVKQMQANSSWAQVMGRPLGQLCCYPM